ncbi:transcriptional regulator, TetR family [Enhydrobacter aerosaccus]|uniref:Transcriptional regulator, TetR family n=1 Tax=Enhydrobacter aerosaccus TaxID=225324 RepID=A0A1T4TEC3_9HYPH|nr:TetR/AcrR family transcriptional regulator [Enhydrobacter aerosaccus]SKA38588.1 transcriptional regulator, TetR family [Enhydrobacter aerosaccus]
MNDVTAFLNAQLPPLPPVLTAAFQGQPRLRKRERTRRQLIAAAARVYSVRGIAKTTVREIAAAAEVAPVTFYNHFHSETELMQAVGTWVADVLCQRIVESYAHIPRGAERMSIGCRRLLWLAEESPPWALLVADVASATPAFMQQIGPYVLADLHLGQKQKEFGAVGDSTTLDLVSGTVLQAMRRIALGLAPTRHALAVVTAILCGLGMSPREARALARRPMPRLATDAT